MKLSIARVEVTQLLDLFMPVDPHALRDPKAGPTTRERIEAWTSKPSRSVLSVQREGEAEAVFELEVT